MISKMFKEPKPLNKEEDKELRFVGQDNYKHVRSTIFLPLSLGEIVHACKSYHVVFIREEDSFIPIGILGYKEGDNIFVSKSGEWKKGVYIPAIARAYPFGIAKQGDQFIVVYDAAYDGFNKKDGLKLLKDDGEVNSDAENIIKFVNDVYSALFQTKELLKPLDELLKPANLNVEKDGQKYVIENVLIVDEEKLAKLDSDKFVSFRNSGLLPFIYAHLISLTNQF